MDALGKRVNSFISRLMPPPRKGPVAAPRTVNKQAWQQGSSPAHRPGRVLMTVSRKVAETRQTFSLWLRAEQGAVPAVQPGQFFTCSVPQQHDGQELRRAYSLSNLPTAEGELRITVKRLKDGRMSGYLHEQLQEGDHLLLSGPSGDFVLPPSLPPRLVMVAAGSGITPIRSLIEAALQQRPDIRIDLYYGCRNQAQIIFAKELSALAAAHPHFYIHQLLSRPGKGWQGARGRMDTAWFNEQFAALLADDCHFYICGPQGLADCAQDYLRSQGVDSARVHLERFLSAPAEQTAHPDTPQRIRFLNSDVEVLAAPGQSVLEAGLAAGIDLGYSCQVGGCGHCRVKLHSGDTVSDQPNCLSDQEYAAGYRLACLSYACNAIEVEA